MTDVSIIQLEAHDWRVLRDFRLTALQADPGVFASSHQREALFDEAEWRRRLLADDAAVYVLRERDRTIGMTGIAVHWDDPTRRIALMWRSWLERGARRCGLSGMMFAARIA